MRRMHSVRSSAKYVRSLANRLKICENHFQETLSSVQYEKMDVISLLAHMTFHKIIGTLVIDSTAVNATSHVYRHRETKGSNFVSNSRRDSLVSLTCEHFLQVTQTVHLPRWEWNRGCSACAIFILTVTSIW